VIDVGKGVLAVAYLPGAALPGIGIDAGLSREWLTLACGSAVIVGHVYPVWFAFRGGKGVATVLGVVGGIDPRLLLPLIAVWSIVLVVTGYVGLASMVAGAALAAVVFWFDPKDVPLLIFCLAIELFVVFTHRANIARMYAGKENRVRRLWLFRSRTA
jgi:glycerol-3-phosphate acyltransferase PlsY